MENPHFWAAVFVVATPMFSPFIEDMRGFGFPEALGFVFGIYLFIALFYVWDRLTPDSFQPGRFLKKRRIVSGLFGLSFFIRE